MYRYISAETKYLYLLSVYLMCQTRSMTCATDACRLQEGLCISRPDVNTNWITQLVIRRNKFGHFKLFIHNFLNIFKLILSIFFFFFYWGYRYRLGTLGAFVGLSTSFIYKNDTLRSWSVIRTCLYDSPLQVNYTNLT